MSELKYRPSEFAIPEDKMRELQTLSPWRSLFGCLHVWATILGLLFVYRFVVPADYFWLLYVPVIFLIAGRFGALLQLIHEGAHDLLWDTKSGNDFIGRWLCSLPVGVNFDGYTSGHSLHHAHAGTDRDPVSDREKYLITDFREPKLYLLLFKDLLGLTALISFFGYTSADEARARKQGPGAETRAKLKFLAQTCIAQLLILGIVFQFNVLHYAILWLYPAVGPHMFLMRIRGIAEHGLARQIGAEVNRGDQGTFYTRSFSTPKKSYGFPLITWVERCFIGSFYVNYHHEHHMFPHVPFYNLPKVHQVVAERVSERNPDVYEAGYLSAAFRSLRSV